MRTRIHADGWLDVSDRRRARTPGNHDITVDPAPEAEALAFLLSHSFPGHRRVIRSMSEADRKLLQLAMWTDSVSERMGLVDRVWRRITEAVTPPNNEERPELIQVVRFRSAWAYPLYLDGSVTRVLPHGGVPVPMKNKEFRRRELQLKLDSA